MSTSWNSSQLFSCIFWSPTDQEWLVLRGATPHQWCLYVLASFAYVSKMHATIHASGIASDSTLLRPKGPGFLSGHQRLVQCRQILSPFLFFVLIRLAASHSWRNRKDLVMKQQHFLIVCKNKRYLDLVQYKTVVFSCCRFNVKKQGPKFSWNHHKNWKMRREPKQDKVDRYICRNRYISCVFQSFIFCKHLHMHIQINMYK